MDFISGERLFHILIPFSNIEFSEICSLNRGDSDCKIIMGFICVVRIRHESITLEYVRDCTI